METTRKLVSEDTLTGLPNRRVMLQRLERALAPAPRERGRGAKPVVLVLIDVDNLREINDALGRSGGDAVMLTIAERLRAALPPEPSLGASITTRSPIASLDASANVDELVAALHASIAAPIMAGLPWQVTAAIGIAQAPGDGSVAEELSRRAGLALSAAQRGGRGVTRKFEPRIEAEHSDRRFLQRELKSAVAREAFDVHYQPIVAANGSGIVGVEALLR